MKIFVLVPAFLLVLGSPEVAHAWGDQGHSIVALVAQEILTTQSQKGDKKATRALQAINNILGQTKIDEAATWPDKVKSQSRSCKVEPYVKDPNYVKSGKQGTSSAICDAYQATADWHFINTDNSQYVLPPPNKENHTADLVVLIKGLAHELKNEKADVLAGTTSYSNWKTECLKKTSHECKKEALEFLIHLVGDIHQPLHSGASCDLGGNLQYITLFGEEKDSGAYWCGKSDPPTCSNNELHQAWDTNLLIHDPGNSPYTTNGDYASKLVQAMLDKKESADPKKCVTLSPSASVNIDEPNGPVGWADESLCYMPQVYSFPDDQSTAKKNGDSKRNVAQETNSIPGLISNRCRSDREVGKGRSKAFSAFQVGQQYYATNMNTINERLYWGGSRLAELLKNIYGKGDKVHELNLKANVSKFLR